FAFLGIRGAEDRPCQRAQENSSCSHRESSTRRSRKNSAGRPDVTALHPWTCATGLNFLHAAEVPSNSTLQRRDVMANRPFGDELLALEKRYWTAMKKKDAAEAMKLTYDTCIITGPQGVREVDHQSLATMMQDTSSTLESFELHDVNVKRVGDEVAII